LKDKNQELLKLIEKACNYENSKEQISIEEMRNPESAIV
jgi:hypothetical protein